MKRILLGLAILLAACGGDRRESSPVSSGPVFGQTVIYPGEDIQSIVDANPPGTEFLLKSGIHRKTDGEYNGGINGEQMVHITIKDGNVFNGEVGSVLSGARVLTEFEREGAYWVALEQTQEGPASPPGFCLEPGCIPSEDLFFNDQPLKHVGSLGEVGPGSWFFDYPADKIYFWDDPSGYIVETSVATGAIFGNQTDDVVVRNLTIEKYANKAQRAALMLINSDDFIVENCEIRLSHAAGIAVLGGSGAIFRNNYIHHQGQLGIDSGWDSDDALIEGNEIAYNNHAGFDSHWAGGGMKWHYTRGVVVRNNYAHHNLGPGLWTDIDNFDVLFEENLVEWNMRHGIYHEIGYNAIIRNNTVRSNGIDYPGWMGASGIGVNSSPDVEIYGNLVEGNRDGILGLQQFNRRPGHPSGGPRDIMNLNVHDNDVSMVETYISNGGFERDGRTGIVVQNTEPDSIIDLYFTTMNNTFQDNAYFLAVDEPFAWDNVGGHWDGMDEIQWQGYGLDSMGTFDRMTSGVR